CVCMCQPARPDLLPSRRGGRWMLASGRPGADSVSAELGRNRARLPSIDRSLALWQEAQRLIPGGAQLLSRRPQLFAFGVSPIFAEKSEGAYFWDVDGNRYLDMTMSVGAVLL